jgi:hypothetical protein
MNAGSIREQAARSRRLARYLVDDRARNVLLALAREYEAEAASRASEPEPEPEVLRLDG